MDFNQLMMKMRELDQPATEQTAEECGMPPTSMPPAGMPPKQETPPPSMSVNLNAQGLDNIEDMMKLFQKVNPDMGPMDKPDMPPLPSMGMEPNIMSIKPSLPPLKMLPDLDADNDDMPGGEKDHMEPDGDEGPEPKMPSDDDGDEEDDKKKSEWANSPVGSESEPEVRGIDSVIPDGNDLNRPKKTFPKVAGGDNPMQKMESGDLRSQIRAELLQRLEEAKQK
jgi:hypothetical protein